MHNHTAGRMLLCLMVMAALFPQLAFAQQQFTASSTADYKAAPFTLESIMPGSEEDEPLEGASVVAARAVEAHQEVVAEAERANKVLAYDPAAIEQIGNQLSSGHSICCPSFSCAYADAVLDGTIHDHSYYCCYSCRWPDWGGGNSAFRCVGSDEQLLREAYDQIAAGAPTVIHVYGPYGGHWIALIGYQNVENPDSLTLDNFVALDPANGAQIVASEKYVLYGDGCEHISERVNA